MHVSNYFVAQALMSPFYSYGTPITSKAFDDRIYMLGMKAL